MSVCGELPSPCMRSTVRCLRDGTFFTSCAPALAHVLAHALAHALAHGKDGGASLSGYITVACAEAGSA